eukprot:6489502-Prymnesium_polylepis.1
MKQIWSWQHNTMMSHARDVGGGAKQQVALLSHHVPISDRVFVRATLGVRHLGHVNSICRLETTMVSHILKPNSRPAHDKKCNVIVAASTALSKEAKLAGRYRSHTHAHARVRATSLQVAANFLLDVRRHIPFVKRDVV